MTVHADVDLHYQHVDAAASSASSIFLKAVRPVTLKFEDVVYKIKTEVKNKSSKEKVAGGAPAESSPHHKMILKGVTGIVRPGEMLAMLGPSGSGKTTLLTALGGRLGHTHLTGSITFNNRPMSNSIKRTMGFVTQDDVMYPHLTVTETLVFTALLRLPKTLTKQEKVMHANTVIEQLGLMHCKDRIIGGQFLRGISGGERKRTSIGQEMLINPSLLFLDEPTSGLDSTNAQRIVGKLRELANGGRTIVMSIHQPSSRVFYMFHKVLLLSEGDCVYFGKGSEATDYFSSIGHSPLVPMNPSDFLLDLANGISGDVAQNQSEVKQNLVTAYKTNLADKVKAELQIACTESRQESGGHDKQTGQWTISWWQQFSVLLQRGVKERRYESFSGLKIMQVLVISLVTGLLWWRTDIAHLQDKVGLLFFYSVIWGLYPVYQAIFTFPPERKMLEKERASRTYRLSSYFMARTIGDLPMELVLPSFFLIITYWMAGLKHSASNFFHSLFTLLLNVLVSQGLGLAIGAFVMNQRSATTLASVITLTFLLVGGFYVQHVPSFMVWIRYISISFYAYKLMLGSQFKHGDTYPCTIMNSPGECRVEDFSTVKIVGLDNQIWAAGALIIMLVGYRLLAYAGLLRLGVPK
uniref:ABC transporter domain-containing protein n=1 Tax=Kalanchoe fedtschenkoi TaxID=63787 RepID=A0A7N0V0K0_KALFE